MHSSNPHRHIVPVLSIFAGALLFALAIAGSAQASRSSVSADHPSNQFTFDAVRLDERHGTATLTVGVPGPGSVALSATNRLEPVSVRATQPGEVSIRIRPQARARQQLRNRNHTTVAATVAFTPDQGETSTQSTTITLRRNPK